MKRLVQRVIFLALSLGLVGLFSGCGENEAPARNPALEQAASPLTLVTNARIYTFDAGGTLIENGALAFDGSGKITAIGDSGPMLSQFPGARRVDFGGKTILPGLIDAHGHLYGLALSFTRANLTGTRDKDEVLARLRDFARDLPAGEWLLGRGWDQNDWPEQVFPDRADLDEAFPDRPVWLRRIDGHAAWANSLAIAEADRDFSGGWQPEGGFVHRDGRGEPTGIFIDRAMDFIEPFVPATSPALIESSMDLATQTLLSLGLTGVHDPGVDRNVIRLYQKKITAGALPVRVYAMADGMNETTEWLCVNGPLNDPSGRLVMRSVKLYADGALGSRGAALLEHYSDDPGNRGLMFVSAGEMESALRRVFGCGLQAGVHAIGDAANRQVLDAYQKILPDFPDNPGRHRVEHAQILGPDDLARFAALDVIAAMQPTHATSDMYWAGERLGEDRLDGAYAWQSLLGSGARLAFGSDFPVEEVNPMLGIHAAVSRQDLEGWPSGGWLPEQRLTRAEAVRAFTLDAAYAGFMEHEVGSLETGKRADFIVLDRDVMEIPAAEIPEVRVIETWVDGERVYVR
ncbi:MAG: amidohydrolase family protein [Xanthomonadales bacterium]|nr:amidohydrolase family protein [Gammaproteobacteria bacterium]MBT8053242.1 amidohydrolase family protein [Gammaproteobacteria bacterium]NND56834.1 amidohydrolase family protein [Xanthomonadales bacterium]NNK50282.1 amidohydrolase family protein [Xanthomonadales bacterium]